MKKSKVLLATTLLGVLAGVVGCGGNSSSSTNANSSTTSTVITSSSSSSSSTVISSSSEAAVPTEALTQEMFSGLQGGYESTFVRSTDYDGAGGSTYILEAKVNDKNYAFKRYSTTIDDNGNYLFIMQPITSTDLKDYSKKFFTIWGLILLGGLIYLFI